jgi:multiple sugar transport system substrate-binding protein
MKKSRRTFLAVASMVGISALVMSGCADAGAGGGANVDVVEENQIQEALSTPTELTFWTWVPDIQEQVDLFMAAYPAIKVKVENVGQGGPHYTAIRTALQAGSGAPDVIQLEFQYVSSFAVTGDLLDLAPYGAAALADQYVPWVWNQVTSGDQVLAIPQDSGPMGNLYRQDIMEAAGVTEPPLTWDDYRVAAEAVRANTDSYISNLPSGQAGQWLALLWQAGVKPFGFDGGNGVTVDVNSDRAKEVVGYWEDLIKRDLVSVDADFTDEWYQGLNQGRYAGWLTAAWAPVFLSGAAADTSGLWRAAPLPQWSANESVSGNWGGSSNAVLATTQNPIAAYELARWINNEQEPALRFATKQFLFPTANSVLSDPAWANLEPEFYGGQRVNEVFAAISNTVDTEFEWLPYMDFAYASFSDTFGVAVAAKGDLAAGLDAWQKALVDYGAQQGFKVNE